MLVLREPVAIPVQFETQESEHVSLSCEQRGKIVHLEVIQVLLVNQFAEKKWPICVRFVGSIAMLEDSVWTFHKEVSEVLKTSATKYMLECYATHHGTLSQLQY